MKFLKKTVTLIMLSLFLISSSGVLVTVHHCCHAHHHAVGDHSHCHNEYHYYKITDQFDTIDTDITCHSDHTSIVLFSNALVNLCKTYTYTQQIHRANHFPPSIWWQHVAHFIFISQHLL